MKFVYKTRLIISGIVLFFAISAFFGFYPLHILNVQLTALIQRAVFEMSLMTVIVLITLFIFTALFGRFYCSLLCPFGILQEFADLIYSKFCKRKNKNVKFVTPNPVKYIICAISFAFLFGGSALIIRYIDPYTIFGSFTTHILFGMIFTVCIIILVFFKNRFFCTSICPAGTLLGLIAKFAPFRLHIVENCGGCGTCVKQCPSRCIDGENKIIGNENCVRCLKCLVACPKGAIKYGFKVFKPKFNFTKRKAIVSAAAMAAFAGAYALGVKFSKNIYKKFKDVILPAGALDAQTMANKCLNCNLCINNCPKGILTKADDTFPAVHIDFAKGKHYCDYNCKKCSDVCPSGAINKITLSEKQSTRIAVATINDHCICCSICVAKCPKNAIKIENGIAKVDGLKCIGCGACASVCPMGAVNIYSVKKQSGI